MMSTESRDRRPPMPGAGGVGRMSLSDRLASVSVRSRLNKDASSLHAVSHNALPFDVLSDCPPAVSTL
jgi:hypothetical protein